MSHVSLSVAEIATARGRDPLGRRERTTTTYGRTRNALATVSVGDREASLLEGGIAAPGSDAGTDEPEKSE
jgi:hypothetical protein